MTGEAAPGPYTENTRVTATAGTPLKVIVPSLSFAPNTIVVKAGDSVTLNIINCTAFQHNFYSPALSVNNKLDLPIAADTTVTFKAPDKPGKYMFWCTVTPPGALSHAERGETGEVIVQ